jgi:transposase-like protein
MEFRVGNVTAKCPGCQGTDFTPPPEERSGPYMKYACASCGAAWTYARLIGQIGREVRRATSRPKGERVSPAEEKMTRSLPYFLRRNS